MAFLGYTACTSKDARREARREKLIAARGPLTNQRLGDKYLLGDLLGQGGFGAVYKARHLLLNRQQAIKNLLEQHFTSPKFRERFTREAQTLAALDHPNIVHVDDFGFDGNRAYLVMPYIGGGTLQQILRARGVVPPDQVLRYLEQIAGALDYAHARNVAHLDMKPLNLLVHDDGRLLLSDFGLAHLIEQGAIEGSTSLQFGSPHYMAPEHIQAQPERRSDIYALGIIVYQMLTGRVPFEGSNAAAIMFKQVSEPPPPLRSIRPELPPALEGVVHKALAKQAADRYETAGALLRDVRTAVIGQISGPLRYSQSLNTTIRAANPPLAGSSATTITPSGGISDPLKYAGNLPLGGVPIYQPVPRVGAVPPQPESTRIWTQGEEEDLEEEESWEPQPKPAKIWTRGFTILFVLIAVAGGILTLVGASSIKISTTTSNQVALLSFVALMVVGLVGLRFAASGLMRAGFVLQVLSTIAAIFQSLGFDASYFLGDLSTHLSLLIWLLNLLSLICVSYALVRWQSADAGLTVLQLAAGIILTVHYISTVAHVPSSLIPETVATAACLALAVALMVLRFLCWRRYPVVILCLAGARVLLMLSYLIYSPTVSSLPFLDLLFLAADFLFVLGFLALVQVERLKKAGVH